MTEIAWALGQWPGDGRTSLHFPENMDTTNLYPEVSSTYTLADGTDLDVECFAPGEVEAAATECIFPFVNPRDEDHVEGCIQPCPVQAYTDEEYRRMWGVSNGIGLLGLILNMFLAGTWLLGGKKHFNDAPYQLKFAVFAGLLYGAVGTLPSLLMYSDLSCGCETEEW